MNFETLYFPPHEAHFWCFGVKSTGSIYGLPDRFDAKFIKHFTEAPEMYVKIRRLDFFQIRRQCVQAPAVRVLEQLAKNKPLLAGY